jgi:hypothetical protein
MREIDEKNGNESGIVGEWSGSNIKINLGAL